MKTINEYIEMMSESGVTVSKPIQHDFCGFVDDERDNTFIVSKDGEKEFVIRNFHIYFGRIVKIKMNTISLCDPYEYRPLMTKRFGQHGYKELYKLQRAVENIYAKQNVSDVRGQISRQNNGR